MSIGHSQDLEMSSVLGQGKLGRGRVPSNIDKILELVWYDVSWCVMIARYTQLNLLKMPRKLTIKCQ